MGFRPNARTLRDLAGREAVHSNELLRRAYKYVARNTTLPARVRHEAQLRLNEFPERARPAAIRSRCIETGRGRGIINEFGLCRVCTNNSADQYQFRLNARAGKIPGVEKASW
ncbi:40S ribosomal protein mrp2, mitochondrial [Malassezia cuniculi]|uniref:40S ribosomal protein mrp2, mitochondrial n=1 Tax=Malassezia cuniculi TaxID=948313 RepID=A0AAF0EUA2_9BASI|nr:40S ribosomal protein mrp2, mitochondrial [Malassezia cuniculi]